MSDEHRLHLKAAVGILASGYVATVATFAALGLVLTKLLFDGPVGRADESMTKWLADHRTGALNGFTNVVSLSADTLGVVGIALVATAVLSFGHRWRAIAVVVIGLSLELACFISVGFLVDRPRPRVPQISGLPLTSSYPSGHTAATFIIYMSVAVVVSQESRSWMLRAPVWIAAVVMPLLVAFSRVYRGMHYPSDVVAGLLLGAMVIAVVLHAVAASVADRNDPVAPDDPPPGLGSVAPLSR
jgi:undecaprenyl-diphosphatase